MCVVSQMISEDLAERKGHGELGERSLSDPESRGRRAVASARYSSASPRRLRAARRANRGSWSWSRGNDPAGSIGFTIDLTMPDPNSGFAILNFSLNGEPRSQRISIQADACRYGGRRYYFICPSWNDRCEVLCGVGGVFASRDFHRLTYMSQSETPMDRLKRAEQKAEARLFAKAGNHRLRGANKERLIEQWCDLSERHEKSLVSWAMQRWGMSF